MSYRSLHRAGQSQYCISLVTGNYWSPGDAYIVQGCDTVREERPITKYKIKR